jgi:5'-deoxynucleotidase YfbR-like HD superfamily hydrolase
MVERTDASWIQTFSGRQFWPLNPRAEEVEIEDVAHALSNLCRYNGHTRRFYSVAQHSVLVSRIVPAADALWGLLHDAPEAYIADLSRPVKRHMPGYRDVERRLMVAVAERFGLSWPEPASVKTADLIALRTERRDLMATPPIPWLSDENVEPLDERVVAVGPEEAKAQFLARFVALGGSWQWKGRGS